MVVLAGLLSFPRSLLRSTLGTTRCCCAPYVACWPPPLPCSLVSTAAVAVHQMLPRRYFRFFSDGTFAYRTSPEPLSKVWVVRAWSGCLTRGLALWQLQSGLGTAAK